MDIHANFHIELFLMHKDLEIIWGSKIPTPIEKGYPPLYDDMVYWVLFADNEAIAYTSSLMMDERRFVLVGNTYVCKGWRSKGLHSHLLKERNKSAHMEGVTKVTVLNPIEESRMENLVKVVTKLGYKQVKSYEDAKDIMTDEQYDNIYLPHQQIWRLD
jgi:RNA-binding protein YhbY